MTRKIVAIHGIGNTQPGWSEFLRLELEIPQENWIEFHYEDLLDRSLFNRLVVSAIGMLLTCIAGRDAAALASMPKDYINDVVSYFWLKKTHNAIQARLAGVLQVNPDAIILAHSLGTVVAYETLKNFNLKAHTLFTLGSPLSKGLVKRFLQVPDFKRPKIRNWFNVWGRFDPIGGKINGLGCKVKDQFRIHNAHDLLVYVHSQKLRMQEIYEEVEEMAS
ncbi:hypothetical protein [Vampirovibrio chlorellavorus]|uniref:hypothetical protein n=1 Tax=Vampirovibrio chlorellavorus TaxID=758823 RepID=UPI0026F2B878|nr:hypothetical protein [Vampirovibrio chlorellavorus]